MKKLLPFLALFMLAGCESAPLEEATVEEIVEENFEVEMVVEVEEPEEIEEEVMEEITIYQPSLQDFYDNPPEGYCDKSYMTELEIWDESNYYARISDHKPGNAMPSYSYCVFTIFLHTAGGYNIYGVTDITETPMLSFPMLGFFSYIDGDWVDVSEDVLSLADLALIAERGEASIAENAPELVIEELGGNWKIELPQYDTILRFKQYNTGDVLYQLKWTGTQFIVVE